MKRGVSVILTLFLLLAVSCGRKNMFILHGTVQDDTDSILVFGFDSRFDRTDTIACKDGSFVWKLRLDTVTTLIFLLPDGRTYPVFADKGIRSTMVIPEKTREISVTGGECNDTYHSFHMAVLRDTAMEQTSARIDSFITRNPFSETTPYLIYEQMIQRYHADEKDITKLINRMSGNMQDAPYLAQLKTEFKGGLPSDVYLESWEVRDSLNETFRMPPTNSDDSKSYMLLCVWATWAGNEGYQARRDIDSMRTKYAGRNMIVADISIDTNTERWKEAISKDTLNWFSYIDTQGWESRVAKSCNITELPVFILLSSSKRALYCTRSLGDMDKELDRRLPKKEEPRKQTGKKK